MIDDDDPSYADNVLRGKFTSIGTVEGTPINETTRASSSHTININMKQGEDEMAEVDTAVLANGHTILANEIAGVRHDVGLAEANVRDSIGQHSGLINKNVGDNGYRIGASEANVRDKIGETEGRLAKGIGDNRYTISSEAASLSRQIGAEACGINQEIGNARREGAEHSADIRYDVATRAGDIRRENAAEAHALSRQIGDGFCATDSKVLERAGDIRREGSEHTNEIIKEGLKGDYNTQTAIKDARFDLATSVDRQGDRVVDRIAEHDLKVADRFFTVGRDLMDLRQGQVTLAKDVELQALKTQLDAKENTRYIVDKVVEDGEKTRGLINDLKYHDLNRGLVERQTELVNCEQDRRLYRDRWHDARFEQTQAQFAGQWAQLQSQIQAFQSQLQETRQGMVNFGTMAGVGQSSTSNNVR